MEQLPTAMKLAVAPLTVQTAGVVEAKDTVSPELAVATSANGVPTVCAPGLAKVIVGAEGKNPPLGELHPVRTAKSRLRTNAGKEVLIMRFIASPETEATKRTPVFQ
jgi:hypothetical protein